MTEAIEELERFKVEMVDELKQKIVEQASVILSTIDTASKELQAHEATVLGEFLALQADEGQARGLLQSPRGKAGAFQLPSIKRESLIDMEMEEANLSEYNSTPKNRVSESRYSDLRPSSRRGAGSISSKSPIRSPRRIILNRGQTEDKCLTPVRVTERKKQLLGH